MRWSLLVITLLYGISAAYAGGLPAEMLTLANGLRVVLHEDHREPAVLLRLRVYAGSARELLEEANLASLVMLGRFDAGSDLRPGSMVRVAGGRSASVHIDRDRAEFTMLLAASGLEVGLRRQREVLDAPLPYTVRVNNDKAWLQERFLRSQSEPDPVITQRLYTELFPVLHPYHRGPHKSQENAAPLTRAQLQRFVQHHYLPGNGVLVVLGDFDPVQARRILQTNLGALPSAPTPAALSPEAAVVAGERRVALSHVADRQRALHLAWLVPPASFGLEPTAVLLMHLLQARLDALRQRGLAAEVEAQLERHQIQSLLWLQLAPQEGVALPALLEGVDQVLAQLRAAPPTEQERAAAGERARIALLRQMDGLQARSGLLLELLERYGDPSALEQELAALERVSAADLQRFAAVALRNDRRVVLRFAPEGQP